LEEKVAAPVQKTEITVVGNLPRWLRGTLLSAKGGTNFADKRRSLGRILRSRTKATVFVCFIIYQKLNHVASSAQQHTLSRVCVCV
jgi:hypothetical protein